MKLDLKLGADQKYSSLTHNILLTTTEYTYGTNILTVQIISKTMDTRIQQSLKSFNIESNTSDQVRYYISKTYNKKYRQIKQSTFLSMLDEFNVHEQHTLQEIFEQYHYVDKEGKVVFAGITIVREKNKRTFATIEFNYKEKMEKFIPPEWLLPMLCVINLK